MGNDSGDTLEDPPGDPGGDPLDDFIKVVKMVSLGFIESRQTAHARKRQSGNVGRQSGAQIPLGVPEAFPGRVAQGYPGGAPREGTPGG